MKYLRAVTQEVILLCSTKILKVVGYENTNETDPTLQHYLIDLDNKYLEGTQIWISWSILSYFIHHWSEEMAHEFLNTLPPDVSE
jgi:hypothetical protein